MNHAAKHPRLFCKPYAVNDNLYFKEVNTSKDIIHIRSLNINEHLPEIHKWVNHPKAKQFWQMDGPYSELLSTYTAVLRNPFTHSFVGFYNNQLICQADIYLVDADELYQHIDSDSDQCGIHFIMAPSEQSIKGLSRLLFSSFLHYYFSFPEAQVMFGEPDSKNTAANKLVLDTGFEFIKKIQLSYKQANLYRLTRQRFLNTL